MDQAGDRLLKKGVTLLVSLALGFAEPLSAQVSYRQEILPAFSSFDVGDDSAPAILDIDFDGDLDLVAADRAGRLQFFENFAGPVLRFVERRGGESPFAAIDVGEDAKPAFVDLDDDGDLDLVAGAADGKLRYFANVGTREDAAFVERLGGANPFSAIDVGDFSAPALADLDGDGDRDLLVGAEAGRAHYFRNIGSAAAASYLELTGDANPMPTTFSDERVDPELVDLDRDGDFDLFTGIAGGGVRYYRNFGSATAADFVWQDSFADPFWGFSAGELASPGFGDLNADGYADVLVGKAIGSLHYLVYRVAVTVPHFQEQEGVANPFAGVHVGSFSSPVLADLDADGDLDAAVGNGLLAVSYFENTGTPGNLVFVHRLGSANPFDEVAIGHFTTPELGDIDGDGDLDLFLGEEDGPIDFFRNVGSPSAPAFEMDFKGNPLLGVAAGFFTSIELADIDADGDLDASVGREAASLVYFENVGTPAAAEFVERSGAADPFAGIDTGGLGIPVLGDVDGDQDLDLLLGAGLLYFENTGSRREPAFTERTGDANPFDGVDLGTFESPELADLDGDRDLDALVGEDGGRLVFFREWRAAVFTDGFESGDTRFWWTTIPGN
jgi:hypothetical protein